MSQPLALGSLTTEVAATRPTGAACYAPVPMVLAQPAPRMTHAEYVVFLHTARAKHEYLRGEIFAMSGGTVEHARLAARVIGELTRLLAGRGCEPFSSDLRVRVDATDFDAFPDVAVVCGPVQTSADDLDACINPTLLVEVLSDSSEGYDRGEKFSHYRRLGTLREYVVVSQKARRLEVFRRDDDGRWVFTEAGPGESLALESLGVALEVDTVYASELSAG
jgi:Uma2 family endonuclease